MSSFEFVDAVLLPWAARKHLTVQTRHQDAEVRSITLRGQQGRAQIWVELGDAPRVVVWDYGKRELGLSLKEMDVVVALERALELATSWCEGR